MALDSKVAFQQRAAQCLIPLSSIDALEANGIDTYATFAFCCNYQPGSQDDGPLFDYLERVLGSRPDAAESAKFRRLFFEAHALCLQDLKSRLERTESSETKILPLAEKVERIRQLKVRLNGLIITPALEPSHQLIDKVVAQYEENSIKYLELSSCTSREQEILSEKASPSLSFDDSGRIKVTKRQELADCSLSGDLKLRSALTRRALAYELAGIASFLTLEKWSNMLFEKLQTDPPPGYRFVNHEQLIRADEALWLKVAEETRARVQTGATLAKPVDVAIEKWCIHPEVQLYLMNMPSNSSGATTVPPKTDPPVLKKPPKTVLKDQTDKTVKGKSVGKGHKITVPDDCEIKFNGGKPICMKFNLGICRANIKPGKRCMFGYHVCWRKGCHKPSSAVECTH